MKVILLTSFGVDLLPKEFKADYSSAMWRMDKALINRIEKKNWVKVQKSSEINSIDKDYCFEIENGVKYVYATPNQSTNFLTFAIVEVDTSRPWCVDEYDGSEGIKYLDNYICVSKETNFHIIKN